jgi:hypothetical protein
MIFILLKLSRICNKALRQPQNAHIPRSSVEYVVWLRILEV